MPWSKDMTRSPPAQDESKDLPQPPEREDQNHDLRSSSRIFLRTAINESSDLLTSDGPPTRLSLGMVISSRQ